MNKKILYIVIAILIVGSGIFFFLGNNKGTQDVKNNQETTIVDDKTMVDCGVTKDPMCFVNRMNECLPVTVKMTGSDNTTVIQMTILGIEDEKCHFERKINNVVDMNCFFPKGTMNMDTLDQTFGNDKGLQKVVDDACKKGW
jgi:hypothetical protein